MIFLDACLRRPTPRPPLWFMRQAGRYLPEYRAIRAKHGFLDMCHAPELVREVTLQPIRRFDVDAAIIFADILLPLVPMGLQLRFAAGEGPVIDNPVRTQADAAALLVDGVAAATAYVGEAISLTRRALSPDKALIGFAGAPFTLACYAIKGCGGNFDMVRRFMYANPATFQTLMTKLTDVTINYLTMQAEAGANALQIFDSWGGQLSEHDYRALIAPHMERILDATAGLGLPRIVFIKGGGHYRRLLASLSAKLDVVGLDWTMSIAESRAILGADVAVQGNLDPMLLFAPPETIRERTSAMIQSNQAKPGYIVNLGHGINKETPIAGVRAFVETVKSFKY